MPVDKSNEKVLSHITPQTYSTQSIYPKYQNIIGVDENSKMKVGNFEKNNFSCTCTTV
jgi:hypothetical protein